MSAVPLFASTSRAATTTASPRRSTASRAGGRYILGPEVEAFEDEFAALPRRAPLRRRRATAPTRSRSRCARSGVGPGDEVVLPVVHLLRDRRGDRSSLGARPVFCDVDPDTFCVTPRDGRGGDDAAARRRSSPCTCSATSRRSPSCAALGRAGARGRRAGGRRDARRRARPGALGDAATFSFFPSKNLGVPRRRRRGRHRRRRASPSARGACASTARRTRRPSPRSATTRASTSSRRPCCACCCPSSTAGATRRRAAARRVRRGRASASSCELPRPVDGADPAWHLYVVRHRRRRARSALSAPASARGLLPHARAPPAGDAPSRRRRAAGHRRGGAHAPRAADEPGPHRATRCDEVVARDARLGRPHEQPARARHAARDRGACARTGTRCEVTARDFAQTLELCERFGIEHTAIGRHRGGRLAAQGASGSRRARRARALGARAARFDLALGHGSNDVTRRRGAAAASPARRRSTTSGRRSSTTSTAGWRARSSCPTRSRPSGSTATARRGKLRRYAGLKEEYYLADFEPDEAVLGELGLDRDAAARGRAHAARRSRSTTASRTRCSRRCSSACGERRQTVVLPRTPEQRAELRAPRAASSCPSARSTRSRWSPTPTS